MRRGWKRFARHRSDNPGAESRLNPPGSMNPSPLVKAPAEGRVQDICLIDRVCKRMRSACGQDLHVGLGARSRTHDVEERAYKHDDKPIRAAGNHLVLAQLPSSGHRGGSTLRRPAEQPLAGYQGYLFPLIFVQLTGQHHSLNPDNRISVGRKSISWVIGVFVGFGSALRAAREVDGII